MERNEFSEIISLSFFLDNAEEMCKIMFDIKQFVLERFKDEQFKDEQFESEQSKKEYGDHKWNKKRKGRE